MTAERPQYYKNTLEPIAINRDELLGSLSELRAAVARGADMVQKNSPPAEEWGRAGWYLGNAGIALAYLRLARQVPVLKGENESIQFPDFQALASQRIFPNGPDLPLIPSRLSPLGSATPLAAVVTRALAASPGSALSKDDISCLQQGVEMALYNGHLVAHDGRNMGGDEPLYGRTGLLLSLLNIRAHSYDDETQKALNSIFEAIPKLVDVVIAGGQTGSTEYKNRYGEKDSMPLMWPWMENYYGLGSVHGASGIISVVIGCNKKEINDSHFPLIAETITSICKFCIAHNGHLPMTIPYLNPTKTTHTLQVCHGSPGILLLMACVRRNVHLTSNYWQPEWDEAICLASDRVWEEGLISKGGGICHGITGNAWPLLFVHDSFQYDTELMETARRNYMERTKTSDVPGIKGDCGDQFLSRALAFMLHARETPPYNTSPQPGSNDYRSPDSPYALTEGLPGTVCAWAASCVAIQMRLRQMELAEQGVASTAALKEDSVFQRLDDQQLGFPTLAYYKPAGLL
ncbi:hypothetical protein ASPWEDRAFT_67057 [Aspergillus wentii DTO 134E9]|uniref:Lanthionine synthetase C family protein n=1 Tax=Aspergillus wentii DTO 134E9 TaxID=1073089 RepID=A0A1L9RPB8_ASPWE|nr:uncharacterized protein ASPWEDRAFT_67057 [Aspergillus wentii DTO 134E9]KAI9934172.1 hypothetical protein MW887_005245 [Aspergillus wentii]OJJ36688.1 hypothetical protein ASPWEDRAFT_67057 [Aspergillus wentii DTO 134E9]